MGNANVFVASMVTPIGMSTKAGQAVTIKTYVNITGQYLTGVVTFYEVNYFGEKMGLSNTQTTLLNIGTGYLQGLAWNKANNVISKIQLRSRSINEHVNINPENVGEGGSSSNQYCLSGEDHFQAYKEMFGEENVEWVSRDTLSSADRLRIQNWKYKPSDELYIKYKSVYQNELYYNQATGRINWQLMMDFILKLK